MNFGNLFNKKGKKRNDNYPNSIILKTQTNIESKVNEIFASTKVTQKLINNTDNPIELEIIIYKYLDNIIFSSFHTKIGSIETSSKVIKKEKAEEKYTDSISSGNAAIYTVLDKYDKNKIIVNIGNIPPKEELTFISEFIQFTESSNNSYEYELLRNLPKFQGRGKRFENEIINGSLEIKTKNKITQIDKKLLAKQLSINEEKNEENGKLFFLKYKYIENDSYYIPTSKIYFSLDSNSNPILFSQNCLKNKNEQSYILNYKLTDDKKGKQEDIKLNPALFIFLIDQSGSMSGSAIKVASKALVLFLQSLPAGSYYQIIGFGSDYKVYDNIPKEYNQKNILESIKKVESLGGDMGGTNIYDPLRYIYDSNKNYDKILLPRNIFLLTDGEIDNKEKTLKLIEKNSNKYSIYSFGIGNSFDEDLIKNAGIIGKGDYSFCKKIDGLNHVIASTLNNICVSYINDFKIISSLDNFNLYRTNELFKVLKQDKVYRFGYLTKEKLDMKNLNFTMEYKQNNEKNSKKYELEPNELSTGDELSKLIIYEYISKADLSEEEKIKLALKYQIFIEGTSLYAEAELSEKNTEPLIHVKEVIKENNYYSENEIAQLNLDGKIKDAELRLTKMETKANDIDDEIKEKLKIGDREEAKRLAMKKIKYTEQMRLIEGAMAMMEEQKLMLENTSAMKNLMNEIKQSQCCIKAASKGFSVEEFENMKEDMVKDLKVDQEELNDFFKDYANEEENEGVNDILDEMEEEIGKSAESSLPMASLEKLEQKNKEEEDLANFLCIDDDPKPVKTKEEKEEKKAEKKEEKKENKKEEKKEVKNNKKGEEKKIEKKDLNLDLKSKENVMQIINCQNFVEGFWDINDKTKIVKKLYEKEFNLLKELKNKKIDNIAAMTIIIIYFINKEHKELLEELVMILKKAKLYIQNKIGDSYENIMKNAGIN